MRMRKGADQGIGRSDRLQHLLLRRLSGSARQLEALGANGEFHDASGGTPYMVFRDDWIACVEGRKRLQGVKLRDDVPTYRSFPLALFAPLLKARTGMLFKTRLR